jgi:hypothetical protein
MHRKLLLVIAASALWILPGTALGSVSVVQDSCRHFEGAGGELFTEVFFSVVNFNSATPICDLHLIPEGTDPGCFMVGCSSPAGWSCALRPDNGADWVAAGSGDCITAGTIKRGFSFTLDPEFCCYIAQFTDGSGGIITEQEECFDCVQVGVESKLWGNVKQLFR